MKLQDYLKDKSKIDLLAISEAWNWLINEEKEIIFVTCFGDLFLTDNNGEVLWLDTSSGNLKIIASDLNEFQKELSNTENFENWFLTNLFSQLKDANILLSENQVYSYKTLPVLGGEYALNNIEPTDILVHFQLTGQICEQIKDLPDGTSIKIEVGE